MIRDTVEGLLVECFYSEADDPDADQTEYGDDTEETLGDDSDMWSLLSGDMEVIEHTDHGKQS